MQSLHAKRHGSYVVIDFEDVSENGLKKLSQALKKSGAEVVSIDATNRKVRRDGLFVKKAVLNFENGQSITLFVGDQGDIYQLSLNGTKQPVPDAKTEAELAKKLAAMLKRNQDKFDKSLLKKQQRPKPTGERPLNRSLSTRSAEAEKAVTQLTDSKQSLLTTLSERQSKLEEQNKSISDLTAELDAEKQETLQLENQLEELQRLSKNNAGGINE